MQLYTNQQEAERVILAVVQEKGDSECEESFAELEELAKTAGAVCVGKLCQKLECANGVTYFGKGKLEELKTMLVAFDATGIVCDTELSPVQMKNLSMQLDTKVMDRTMLILDIFAARANTKEGKIQVELAQLKYNATMLAGLRPSLSRLGGGIGTRGPGEKKLEMDRRLIREQISRLKQELIEVKKHRETQRKRRSSNSAPVVCIVGYTNAGKSTLLNCLTQSQVLAEDKLFATLDPATRMLQLPNGKQLMLTDTVGFISRLPHHLIQAFRSTLEEAKYSDLILHVVDASNPDMDRQMFAVYETLRQLGIEDKPIVTVFNKIDKMSEVPVLRDLRADGTTFVSAKNGQGMEELLNLITDKLRENQSYVDLIIPYKAISLLGSVRKYGELLHEEYQEEGIRIIAYVRKQDAARLKEL